MAFRWRVSKKITIIPKMLHFTINKKSWSVNLHLGFYSHSWGSARETSTVDLPGEMLSLRNQHKTGDGGFEGLWIFVIILILIAQILANLFQIYILPSITSTSAGSPSWLAFVAIFAVTFGLCYPIRRHVYTPFLLLTIGSVLTWLAVGNFVL